MTKETRTQWHPAFCAAMRLELIENKEDLDYTNEYNLNSKPIQMDLLVIKKSKDVEIKNEIGKIFRGHNIMEYKSPDDELNLDTYVKVIGYACMYKASEVHAGDIDLDDITITLIREGKPRELLKWFVKNDYEVCEKYKGIYYVEKIGCFPIQVIVSGKLSVENQKWLTLLSRNLNRKEVERIVLQTEKLTQNDEKLYADSVLRVAVKENKETFRISRGESENMFESLRELMKEDLDEATKIGEERGREEVILNSLRNGRTAEAIAEFLGIPLEEVKAVEKKM
ncbi:MAG: hypothetical protein IKU69_03470 [Roseburia sp.]|nr:hypothetical protein [Roseburia sp.]